jgi:hypothetical protein
MEKLMGWRRICGPKRNEVAGGWRTPHNEELRDLYFSPTIIKSRRMRLLVGKPKGKGQLERPRRKWVIIERWILERWDGVVWTGLVWLWIGTNGELL